MKFLDICTDIVTVTKNKNISQIYDVDLQSIDRLKDMGFSSVECHIVLYPYSRKVTTEHFEFTPFEEYVNDILSHQRSAYTKIKNHFCNLFGLIVGIMIAVFSYIFKTSDLFSIESIVSILGAYFVGKELWGDIEDLVVNMTRDWRIRYRERYYFYRLEKHTTLSQYSRLAKKRRYGKSAMLPEKMDFNQKRNSETIRLYFNMRDLKSVKDKSAHILSIRLEPAVQEDFERDGFLFGVKLSFNKRLLGITRSREYFQSIDKDLKGCLDESGEWSGGTVFYRNTFSLGRLKWFMNKGLLVGKSIVRL